MACDEASMFIPPHVTLFHCGFGTAFGTSDGFICEGTKEDKWIVFNVRDNITDNQNKKINA